MGLFKPAYKSSNTAKAIQAVGKIDDQGKLKAVVYDGDVSAEVRAAAAEKLSAEDDLFRVLCDTNLPSPVRKAAIPHLSQEALIAYASMGLVGSNTGGEEDMAVSRIADKKAVARAHWAKNKQCFNLEKLGYTEDDVIKLAESHAAPSVQYKDCVSYVFAVKSPQLHLKLAQIMASHPVNAKNRFFDEGLVQRLQAPDRPEDPWDTNAEAREMDRACRSAIARDWLLARKDDRELMAQMNKAIGNDKAPFYVCRAEDWLDIALQIPEMFGKACYNLDADTVKAKRERIVSKAGEINTMAAWYPVFRLFCENDPEAAESIVPRMDALVDYDNPSYFDLQFILDLDRERCTDRLLKLFATDAAANAAIDAIRSRVVLMEYQDFDLKRLDACGDPTVQKHVKALRKMLREEYERSDAHYQLSDHTGEAPGQSAQIRAAIRQRHHMDD